MQHKKLPAHSTNYWTDILLLLFVLSVLFFLFLGTRPLFVPDEGRYAEIAREMISNHDFVTPTLNGIKYFEKPVLYYWLCAAAIKIAGLNLWSIRSVNALLALVGCIATYITGRKLFDRKTGFLAALILGTSTLYFVMSHMITLDLPVSVFLSICLFSFMLGTQEPSLQTARYYFWTASVFAAFAVLTKGLIGLLFPSMIIFTWILCTRNWRLLQRIPFLSCLAIFFTLAAPWHLLVGLRHPEFSYFYFIEQHFLRYATLDVGHYQPAWFFIPTLVLGFFPWIIFLPQALWSTLKKPVGVERFFLLWSVLIFLFFSFSKSKLVPYILPVFPPLTLLVAVYLTKHATRKSFKFAYPILTIFSIVIVYNLCSFSFHHVLPNPADAKLILVCAGFVILIGSGLCLLAPVLKKSSLTILISSTAMFLVLLMASVSAIDTRSIQPLANIINQQSMPVDDIITFNQYYQDLPFYLQRRVSILNWRNELSYGMQHQDTQDWMINDTVFWQRWHSDNHIYVMLSVEELSRLRSKYPHESFILLGQTINNAVITNKTPNLLIENPGQAS